jgi:hypothetical protein
MRGFSASKRLQYALLAPLMRWVSCDSLIFDCRVLPVTWQRAESLLQKETVLSMVTPANDIHEGGQTYSLIGVVIFVTPHQGNDG